MRNCVVSGGEMGYALMRKGGFAKWEKEKL